MRALALQDARRKLLGPTMSLMHRGLKSDSLHCPLFMQRRLEQSISKAPFPSVILILSDPVTLVSSAQH